VLIVFAREPIAGAVKTRLIPRLGAVDAARLADAFIVDALTKAASFESCKLVIAGSARGPVQGSEYFLGMAARFRAELVDQGRGDLGQRMARVLALYAEPPGALLFGTDTPTLPRSYIAQSIDDLRKAPVVIAPTLDGGYYLVGVRGLVPDIFRAIQWSSEKVLEQTLRRLVRAGIPYLLAHWWYDIDRAADLEFLVADLTRDPGARSRRAACPATTVLLRELGLSAAGKIDATGGRGMPPLWPAPWPRRGKRK
jgi:rSAM/selenodomain-associated transferase 1